MSDSATPPHQCLGQHIARLELRIALTELFRRVEGLPQKAAGHPGRADAANLTDGPAVNDLEKAAMQRIDRHPRGLHQERTGPARDRRKPPHLVRVAANLFLAKAHDSPIRGPVGLTQNASHGACLCRWRQRPSRHRSIVVEPMGHAEWIAEGVRRGHMSEVTATTLRRSIFAHWLVASVPVANWQVIKATSRTL